MTGIDLIIIFAVKVFATFYSASTGGGGLLIVPTLILLGLPPHTAVATAMFSYIASTGTSLFAFHKAQKVDMKIAIIMTLFFSVGIAIGSFILVSISPEYLKKIIGVLTLIILVLVATSKKHGLVSRKAESVPLQLIGYTLFIPLGILNAITASGSATIATYMLIFFFGKTFLEAAATRKLAYGVRTVITTIIYGPMGIIHWPLGFYMLGANAIGAYIGTKYALKKGDNWVKWLFVVVVSISALKLLY